jgi:hypothetical protein
VVLDTAVTITIGKLARPSAGLTCFSGDL